MTTSRPVLGEERPTGVGPTASAGGGSRSSLDSAPPAGLTVTVYGSPKTKGSMKHVGKGRMVEQVEGSKPWRQAVIHAVINESPAGNCPPFDHGHRPGEPCYPLHGPVAVEIVYSVPRPTAHYRTGRNAHLLRDNAPLFPATQTSGDADKIARNCCDALTDARAFVNDAQVADLRVRKVFLGDPGSLDRPGALIRVTRLGGVA